MDEKRNETLQKLCRDYLKRLRYLAKKHNLSKELEDLISKNARKECSGTERECQMLARMIDDERISRVEIPTMLGKSYRQCCENGVFDKIKTLKRVGIYSKVGALLFKERVKE